MLNRKSQLTALALSLIVIPAAAYTGRSNDIVDLDPVSVLPTPTPLPLDTAGGGVHPTPPPIEGGEDGGETDCSVACDATYEGCYGYVEFIGQACFERADQYLWSGAIDYATYLILIRSCEAGLDQGGYYCDQTYAKCLKGCLN